MGEIEVQMAHFFADLLLSVGLLDVPTQLLPEELHALGVSANQRHHVIGDVLVGHQAPEGVQLSFRVLVKNMKNSFNLKGLRAFSLTFTTCHLTSLNDHYN